MPRPRRLTSAIAIAAFTLAGCTGAPGLGAPSALKAEDSPLTKYLANLSLGPGPDATKEEQQAYYDEQQKKTEQLVAECMKKEGFEYKPNTTTSVTVGGTEENPWKPDDREWVKQYGYGSVNFPGKDDAPVEEPTGTEQVDPNQEYLASLTEAEQQAYNEALYGGQAATAEPTDAEPTDEAQTWDWTKQGCYGAAQHEVMGDQPYEKAEFKPLIDALQKFYEGLPTNTEYSALDSEWVACMDTAGHTGFKTQSEASNSIYDLVNKYYEEAYPADGGEETEMDPNLGTLKDPAFAEIGKKEVELALADLDCREKTDYRNRQLTIQFKLEDQFISDHKAELDALKASADQGQR